MLEIINKFIMDIKEVAYHEAGHAVIGYLFFPPVETTIISESNRFGNTIADIPLFIAEDEFLNELFFPTEIMILLFSWAGEYFQRKISAEIVEGGLVVDTELLNTCFDKEQFETLVFFKEKILEFFFENKIIEKMVDAVAMELLIKKKLSHIEIHTILLKYKFDYDKYIEKIMDEYYLPICEKYKEILSTK